MSFSAPHNTDTAPTIDLIREEVARYQSDSDSWSGNGAYLGLVLTVAHRMPLPTDLLEAILQMPQTEREQVFGDQFDLIVQAVALTPLKQHDFIEQWIWDAERCNADRRDMIDPTPTIGAQFKDEPAGCTYRHTGRANSHACVRFEYNKSVDSMAEFLVQNTIAGRSNAFLTSPANMQNSAWIRYSSCVLAESSI